MTSKRSLYPLLGGSCELLAVCLTADVDYLKLARESAVTVAEPFGLHKWLVVSGQRSVAPRHGKGRETVEAKAFRYI